MKLVVAVLQHVAPLPQSPLFGVHFRIEMQIPLPLASRSTSHCNPRESHCFPPLVHGVPMPLQFPAVVGHVSPVGGVQVPGVEESVVVVPESFGGGVEPLSVEVEASAVGVPLSTVVAGPEGVSVVDSPEQAGANATTIVGIRMKRYSM
jgi:hypothetical protein